MRIMGRSKALFAVLATAAVLTAGCGAGPSKVESAAIVGGQSISLDSVQQELNWLLENSPTAQQAQQQRKFDLNARNVVDSRITHELLQVAAQREGIRADQNLVNSLIDQIGGEEGVAKNPRTNVSVQRARQWVEDYVLLGQLGAKYAGNTQVDLIGAMVTEESPGSTAKDKAVDLAKKVAAEPLRLAELFSDAGLQPRRSAFSVASTQQPTGVDPTTGQPEQNPFMGLPGTSAFGAKSGTVIVVQPSAQQAGWLVALVGNRDGNAPPPQTPLSATDPVALEFGKRLLQPIAEELGVQVNPRYGLWDTPSMAVLPNADEVYGYEFPAKLPEGPARP